MSQDQPPQKPESQPAPPSDGDAPHKPADDKEEVYFEGSPKLRGDMSKMFWWSIIALVLIVGPIMLWAFKVKWFPWWVGTIVILLGLFAAFIPILAVKTIRYRISNYRIDFERGILSKNIDTLELWHVEDINFHQSLFDRMLGVGTITIISHDETTPRLEMAGIPNPRPLFEQLKQRVIAVKRQRGVIKMDVG